MVQYTLMVGDFGLRDDNSGDDLTFQQQLDNHSDAHAEVGAPPETFTSHIPLAQVAEYNPLLAQMLWDEITDSDGIPDSWFSDGLKLGFNADIAAQQNFQERIADYADQGLWYGRLFLSLLDLGSVELAELYNEAGQAFEDAVEAYKDFIDDVFGANDPTMAPWLGGLLGGPAGFLLPEWMDGPLGLFGDAPSQGSPLVLDLDGDGIELTTFNASTTTTFFDLDGDGFAEQTAWVGADDGMLVRDVDQNGTIDDVSELFGSMDIDGFAKLALLDSNGDLIINADDTAWSELQIWQDANGDGVSQSAELLTLASLNIVGISLQNVEGSTTTISGNPISHTSTFMFAGGSTGTIVDAWFVHDDVNTKLASDYDLDVRALFLPTLRGFGEVADMHVVMSENEDLLDLVSDFVSNWDFDAFADGSGLDDDIADIIFEWGGVGDISPTSRGNYVDGQALEFMENFFASEFTQIGTGGGTWPYRRAAGVLMEAWEGLFKNLKAQFLVQTGAKALFDSPAYNPYTGELEGDLSLVQSEINALVAYSTDTGVSTLQYWVSVADYIEAVKGLSNLTGTEEGWLDSALASAGLSETWSDIEDILLGGSLVGSEITGTSGDDVINGTALNDTLRGAGGVTSGGFDEIYGGDGDDYIESASSTAESQGDELYGENGDDVLVGRLGDDYLSGGYGDDELDGGYGDDILDPGHGGDIAIGYAGNDTYIYTGGDDVYDNNYYFDYADKILMPSGIAEEDLTFYRSGNSDLLIEVGALGTILVVGQFNVSVGSQAAIEIIEFADSSTIDLTAIDKPTTYGTDGNDTIYGISYGASGSDVIYGLGGNDTIQTVAGGQAIVDGGAGNDTLKFYGSSDTAIASAGFDTLIPYGGTDLKLIIPEGYSPDDLTFWRTADSQSELKIQIAGLGQISLPGQFVYYNGQLDTIEFEDLSPSIDVHTLQVTTYGTSGNDYINGISSGASDDNIIYGYEGNDTLIGSAGDDHIYAGSGNDYMAAGGGINVFHYTEGMDTIASAFGIDTVLIEGGTTINDISVVSVGSRDAKIIIDSGVNEIYLDDHRYSIYDVEEVAFDDGFRANLMTYLSWTNGTASGETLNGNANDNVMIGFAGNDTINGAAGADQIHGGEGNDTLNGGDGDDLLHGGVGDDTLYGNDGLDTLFGGDGADTFVFEAASAYNDVDVVSDFDAGADVIDITDLLTAYDPMTDALTDFVQITDDGTHSTLAVDADGGADNFVAVASILNVTGLTDENALASSGALLVA